MDFTEHTPTLAPLESSSFSVKHVIITKSRIKIIFADSELDGGFVNLYCLPT